MADAETPPKKAKETQSEDEMPDWGKCQNWETNDWMKWEMKRLEQIHECWTKIRKLEKENAEMKKKAEQSCSYQYQKEDMEMFLDCENSEETTIPKQHWRAFCDHYADRESECGGGGWEHIQNSFVNWMENWGLHHHHKEEKPDYIVAWLKRDEIPSENSEKQLEN